MLTNATFLKGLPIQATDGELGSIEEFLFDDENWRIRYLVVDTGGWLNGRRVLISPVSILQTDWPAHKLDVSLTLDQVQNSPDIATHEPVSRQHEVDYLGYFGYPYYWNGPYYWGPTDYPARIAESTALSGLASKQRNERHAGDSHLRSSKAVTGYDVEASDGEIGHVDGFVVDDQSWAIRYLSVATRNWLPGKKVLVSPAWAEKIGWIENKLYLALDRQTIKSAPEYLESRPLTREYEDSIYAHYGRAPYWLGESAHAALLASGRV